MRDIDPAAVIERPSTGGEFRGFDLSDIYNAGVRQAYVIAACCLGALAIGLAYVVTAAPLYTATTTLLIDSQKNKDQLDASIADMRIDSSAIDSQVEIITSDAVAHYVVKELDLINDAGFRESSGLLGRIVGGASAVFNLRKWFTSREVTTAEENLIATRDAVERLKLSLSVRRVPRTYVLTISYTHGNPRKAANVANAYANAYFADQLGARFEITKRASGWLSDRIAELRDSSIKSDLAVQKFKSDNGLVSISGANAQNVYLSDQQLSEANAQISIAKGETAKAEAKLQQIEDLLRAGKMDAAVTESLGSPVINDIRSKYLRASKMASELETRVGGSHFQVVSLRNEMKQYERLIFEELARFAQTYRADVEIARAREKNLRDSMQGLISSQAVSNRTMVELRNLEREAETFKVLYQTFLQRYQDAIQRQSFPSTEARIITAATPPVSPSAPKVGLILMLSSVVGLSLGGGVAWYREARSSVFRDDKQIQDEIGLPCLGLLPDLKDGVGGDAAEQDAAILRYAVTQPMSGFAETLRSIKLECDLTLKDKAGARVIGLSSSLPTEGKTTTAMNFASHLAVGGAKVILVDGDLRNPGLTRRVAPDAEIGLLEVLSGDADVVRAIKMEIETGLHILPAVVRRRPWQSAEMLSSQKMHALIESLRAKYDYVIVDLPPVGPVVDVRAGVHLIDALTFVVEWSKTPRAVVSQALLRDAAIYDRCIGIVLNKVRLDQVPSYSRYGKLYHYGAYGTYGVQTAAE